MRLFKTAILASLSLISLATLSFSQDAGQVPLTSSPSNAQTVSFQSDISRLMRVVVSHLYHHRDVFLRELLSNAGDAIEKMRVVGLTDGSVWKDGEKVGLGKGDEMNITIRAVKDEEGGRLIIRDNGIGMTREELTSNLGTIARSGTSEFLNKIEEETKKGKASGSTGSNLIGQFGLGFYSSFLVADRVLVASKSPKSSHQYVFESEADASSFKIGEDPRGNTLGRGTELTLFLKSDAAAYLSQDKLQKLVSRNSEFSTSAPIYLWKESEISIPDPDSPPPDEPEDDDDDDEEGKSKPSPEPKMIQVKQWNWEVLNDLPPIWTREPKDVTEQEYQDFFTASFKQSNHPVGWSHFKGDAGSTSFRALIYVPKDIPQDFYSKSYQALNSLKLYVKRVFITNDLGQEWLPKWLNWVKVIVDADDLPLNVGRDSLQKNKSLKLIKQNVIKKAIDLFVSLSKDPAKFTPLYAKTSPALKLGVLEESPSTRNKLVKLLRFESSAVPHGELVTLKEYSDRRKKGQQQMFYIASAGQERKDLEKSPFVEKIIARGYEVFYFTEPLDEMLVTKIPTFEGLKFQDVAKKGIKFGDEDEEVQQEELEELKIGFRPLTEFMKPIIDEFVNDIVISTRLTTSPCAVVVDNYAWTGNMERLMAAQSAGRETEDFMTNFMKSQKKTFEINPDHPLIKAMLRRVRGLGSLEEGEEKVREEEKLVETTKILWDTSSVRSGFFIKDMEGYVRRIESLLRRSIGVDEAALATGLEDIKPAPPVESGPRPEEPEVEEDEPPVFDDDDDDDDLPSQKQAGGFGGPDNIQWEDWQDVKKKAEEGKVTGRDEL